MTEFSEAQLAAVYPVAIEKHYWNVARNKIILGEISRLGLTDATMLEIGCGTGVVLRALRSVSSSSYGVDLAAHESAADIAPFTFYETDFTALPVEFKDKVTLILLCDVIEHIQDDVAFLNSIKLHFPNVTHLFITIPARPELWSNYDTYYGHFRRYTRASIAALAHASSLEVTTNRYFFHGLYLPARLLGKLKISRQTTITPPRGIGVVLHYLLGMLFYFEFKLLPKQIAGTSILFVAKV